MKRYDMKILTFKRQIILEIILIIIGNMLAFVFHNGIFTNIVWIMYGLLFIINPVYPEQYIIERKGKIGARIAGIISTKSCACKTGRISFIQRRRTCKMVFQDKIT